MRDTARNRQGIACCCSLGLDECNCAGRPDANFVPAGRPLVEGQDATPHAGKRLGWVLPAIAVGVVALCSGLAMVLSEVSR